MKRHNKKRNRNKYADSTVDNRARLLADHFCKLWNARSIKRGEGPLWFVDKRAA